jgi:hypothetical protein
MSGFLHQLAARSLGLAPQIKLRSALPYAAPALDSLPLAAINTEYPPTTERIVGIVPPLSIPDTTRRDALHPDERLPEPLVAINANGLPMNGRSSSPPSPATVAGEDEQPRRQNVAFSTPKNSTESSSGISQSIRAETGLRPKGSKIPTSADFIQPTQTVSSENDLQNRLPNMATLVARLIGQDAPQTAPQATQQTERPSQPTSSKLATLIPRPVASHIRPPANRESQQAAATESAPEVHITIGRLEVNPPARPAPSPPPRPRGPAPLSLSDYLARRQGGRS